MALTVESPGNSCNGNPGGHEPVRETVDEIQYGMFTRDPARVRTENVSRRPYSFRMAVCRHCGAYYAIEGIDKSE